MSTWNPSPEYLAQREKEASIAEKVFGYTVLRNWPCGVDFDSGDLTASQSNPPKHPRLYGESHPVIEWRQGEAVHYEPVPEYTEDMAACWQVVEAMHKKREAHEINCAWFNFWANSGTLTLMQLPAAGAATLLCNKALESLEPMPTFAEAMDRLAKDTSWSLKDFEDFRRDDD